MTLAIDSLWKHSLPAKGARVHMHMCEHVYAPLRACVRVRVLLLMSFLETQ